MESVGRLSGGIAHDFNNLLTAILGSAELLRETLPTGSPEREEVAEIEKASRRAAELTHQLLAFSRQQMLAPDVLDLNALVTELNRMLSRVVGEDIHFETRLAKNLGQGTGRPRTTRPGHHEPGGECPRRDAGRGDADHRDVHRRTRPGRTPSTTAGATAGEFMVVSVSDTGSGIRPEVLPHIFEPFYTTKAPGVGTGLGLATAYGIVKQSGGYIWVYSEVGKGTTFKVYLPRWVGGERARAARNTPMPTNGARPETILVVEDEPGIRRLSTGPCSDTGTR